MFFSQKKQHFVSETMQKNMQHAQTCITSKEHTPHSQCEILIRHFECRQKWNRKKSNNKSGAYTSAFASGHVGRRTLQKGEGEKKKDKGR